MLRSLIVAQADGEVAESASNLWESVLEALPRLGVAVAVVVVGYLAGRLLRMVLKKVLLRSHTDSFATVMSKLASWVLITVAVLLGITIVFPSIAPVDLLAGLGFFSVAIGFAFQDILENLLAGVLLLFRQPFQAGDQIEVNGHLGTVERITIRETRLKTFDGQRVLIPNADVYKNAIRVQTAFEQRRMAFVVGVAYEADLDEARTAIVDAMKSTDGVIDDPAPEALITELGAATVNYQARFWTSSPQHDALETQDRVIENVKNALDEAGVEMPSDIVALQATASFAAAIQGGKVTPGGSVEEEPEERDALAQAS